jgi:hypothetical protein
MASVRTDESLPPGFPAWAVELNNADDPVDEAHENPLPFQPLIVCLRFLGLELDPAILKKSSRCYRYLSLLLGLILLLLNGLCNIYILILNQHQMAGNQNGSEVLSVILSSANDNHQPITESSTMSWNFIMDYVNYVSLAIGVHACLFILSRQPKWELLCDNVQQILQQFKDWKKTIRRVTIAGLFIISSVFNHICREITERSNLFFLVRKYRSM